MCCGCWSGRLIVVVSQSVYVAVTFSQVAAGSVSRAKSQHTSLIAILPSPAAVLVSTACLAVPLPLYCCYCCRYLRVVKLTLLGSIIGNLLLVMGSAFVAGGIFHPSQTFNQQGINVNCGLLILSGA